MRLCEGCDERGEVFGAYGANGMKECGCVVVAVKVNAEAVGEELELDLGI